MLPCCNVCKYIPIFFGIIIKIYKEDDEKSKKKTTKLLKVNNKLPKNHIPNAICLAQSKI